MSEIEQAEQELIEEFGFFDNWMDRYQYLIELGRRLPDFPSHEMTEENKLQGCQSQVWLVSSSEDGRMHYRATSDAAIVKGLIAVVLRVYDDRPPEDIVAAEPSFIAALGFDEHLSPTRSNGLMAMLKSIRARAAAECAGTTA
ncbi:SufE family protein [Lentisalinibacter salinarum]|uniref:SufE family protein n=1 Tax=Lentisalinibacter salinarum TaxID=2992239 RepID=UPI00386B9E81